MSQPGTDNLKSAALMAWLTEQCQRLGLHERLTARGAKSAAASCSPPVLASKIKCRPRDLHRGLIPWGKRPSSRRKDANI